MHRVAADDMRSVTTLTAARFDLRNNPDWAPIQSLTDAGGGWRIWSWEEPRLPGEAGWDTTLVVNLGPTLRLAVADAAENVQVPDSAARAARATHTVRGWLRNHRDPEAALAGASAELHDPTLPLRHHNPMATAAVLDINRADGTATALRAADSEVWVKRGGEWESVFLGDMLTPRGRAIYRDAVAALAEPTSRNSWAVQEVVLDDPACWASPVIGFDTVPRLERVELGVFDEAIVATDGSRLTSDRCHMLAHWLSHDIQIAEQAITPARPSPHGDIGVLWVTSPFTDR